jgi:hypothetical protein
MQTGRPDRGVYVRTHLAKPGQPVEGLIIAHDADEPLLYAVAAFQGLQLMTATGSATRSATAPRCPSAHRPLMP